VIARRVEPRDARGRDGRAEAVVFIEQLLARQPVAVDRIAGEKHTRRPQQRDVAHEVVKVAWERHAGERGAAIAHHREGKFIRRIERRLCGAAQGRQRALRFRVGEQRHGDRKQGGDPLARESWEKSEHESFDFCGAHGCQG